MKDNCFLVPFFSFIILLYYYILVYCITVYLALFFHINYSYLLHAGFSLSLLSAIYQIFLASSLYLSNAHLWIEFNS